MPKASQKAARPPGDIELPGPGPGPDGLAAGADMPAPDPKAGEPDSPAHDGASLKAAGLPTAAHVPALRAQDSAPGLDQQPKRRWIWAGATVAILACAILIYLQPWGEKTAQVAVEVVAPGPIVRVLAVNGRVAALHSVAVRAAVGGTLEGVLAEQGDQVTAGDVVARVDTALPRAVVQQVVAALQAGEVARQQAAATFRRTEAMGANVPRVTLEDAARTLESAENEVRRLSALVDQAQIQLDRFTVKAPITGTILSRAVDPGQLVDPSMTLFTLADLSQLVVEADVDETYAAQIAVGQAAVLQLVGETRTRPGHVSFVAPEVTVETGGLLVKVVFESAPPMPVGLTVTANITVDSQASALSAPRSAIVTESAGSAVFLFRDGTAHRTPVSIVDWPADRLLVTSGLAAGDSLIVTAAGLEDGQAVTVAGP